MFARALNPKQTTGGQGSWLAAHDYGAGLSFESWAWAWVRAWAKVISAAGCINPAMNNLVVRQSRPWNRVETDCLGETFKPQELRPAPFDHPSVSGGGALAANSSHECPPLPRSRPRTTSLVDGLLSPGATTLNRVWMAWRTAAVQWGKRTNSF